MQRILCFLSLALLLGTISAQAQSKKIDFEEFDLPNGLHVILYPDNSVPLVAVSVLYHVGAKDEKPGRSGFAHFFEHLMFEGSKNIERGEYSKIVERAGGSLNAYTTYDKTFYYDLLPSNQLELGLWLESERMLHAKVDDKGVETQREVVKEERRQRYDNSAYGLLLESVMALAFKEHKYRITPIGSMDDINAAEESDYIEFYQTYYVPNNATLVVSGDIDTKQAKKLVTKYFSEIPKGKPINRDRVAEPEQTEEYRGEAFDPNIQLPAVAQAFKTPGIGKPDFYTVKMLMKVLSDGESSRLVRSLKDDKQMVLYVGANSFELEDDPSVSLAFGIAAGGIKLEDLEAAMNEEYQKLMDELISEEEFEKLRNQVENDFYRSNERVASIAGNLADYHVFRGGAANINKTLDEYRKVTREDIQAAAKKYLRKENRSTLYYLPKPKEEAAPEASEDKGE
ncbi:MAG: M16 family metallopeptidase [Bernardetiaceae bacterium]